MRFLILIIGRANDSLWSCCGCWSLPRQEHIFKEGLQGECVCECALLQSINFITYSQLFSNLYELKHKLDKFTQNQIIFSNFYN